MEYVDYCGKKADVINQLWSQMDEKDGFIFFCDTHWGANCKKSQQIIEYLISSTPMDKVVWGGDVITHSDSNRESMMRLGKQFRESFSAVEKFYCIIGNHDNNSYEQTNPKAIFSFSEVHDFLYNSGKYTQRDSHFFDYYFDCKEEKTRYICLDTSQREKDADQELFLCETLLHTPERYHIVIMAHIWLEWEPVGRTYIPNEQTNKMFELFRKFNARGKWEKYDFSRSSAKIVLLLGGHIHNDFVTFDYAGGIPIVLSDCDAMYKSCNRRYPPQKGFPSEQCVNCVILDYTNEKFYFIRVGRGENFMIDCESSSVSNF